MVLEILPEEAEIARQAESVRSTRRVRQTGADVGSDPNVKLAPKNTEQAAKFLREQHGDSSKQWHKMCLKLQRSARGIPPLAPTALSAALITPMSERVTKISDLRRGMVAYCDDPNDSNPAGHIFFVAGRSKTNVLLTWTNDAKGAGSVSIVPFSFYRTSWGDSFQFGATWLNGYDFSEFDKPPAPVDSRYEYLGSAYEKVIEDLKRIQKAKEKRGADKVASAVGRDIALMEKHLAKWKRNN